MNDILEMIKNLKSSDMNHTNYWNTTVVLPALLLEEIFSMNSTFTLENENNSTNISTNTTKNEFNSFYFYETEQFTVLWILFTVIVLGNSAVLITLYLNKKRKSRMNYFIKQLAIADLLVGLLNVLVDIVWKITVSWRAGNLACKLIRFLQVSVTYGSNFCLVALSIDRFDAITNPMNFSGSWTRAKCLVAVAWILSIIFSLPMIFLYEEKTIQGQIQCWIEFNEAWKWQLYMSLVSTSLFFLPVLIITACYAVIIRTIWKKGAVMSPPKPNSKKNIHPHELESRRASSRGIIPRAKVKTVKMTFVIVFVFVVCWSPYILFDLLQVFDKIPRTQTNVAVATLIQSLAPLNSAANPLIYCLFSAQGMRTLRRLQPLRWIQLKCCCQQNDTNASKNRVNGHNLRNSCDSARTFTTTLTSRRSTLNTSGQPTSRVTIVEQPQTVLKLSEV